MRWRASSGLTGGTLAIGMVSTAKYFVPRLLALFRAEHPAVDVRLRVGNREQLVQLMQRNDVDLAIMGRPPKELATRAEPFATHPHVLVTAADHRSDAPGAACRRWRWSREGFIVREQGSGTRAALEEFLREHRVEHAHHDGDVEQRDDQAGGDGRHGREPAVAAHDRRWS